jgi:hypothetical protein
MKWDFMGIFGVPVTDVLTIKKTTKTKICFVAKKSVELTVPLWTDYNIQ